MKPASVGEAGDAPPHTDAGSRWLPDAPSDFEVSMQHRFATFNTKDAFVKGRLLRLFSWGYELWGAHPVLTPLKFCRMGVSVFHDVSYGAPAWLLRGVRLKADAPPITLQAEVDFRGHPFVDAAIRVDRDALAADAVVIYHSLAGRAAPPLEVLTPPHVAGVALQMLLLLESCDRSAWSFAHGATWRYAVCRGAVLVRLADVSSCLPRRATSGTLERKCIGVQLVRLITQVVTEATSAAWAPALSFAKDCFTGGGDAQRGYTAGEHSACLQRHPFVARLAGGDPDAEMAAFATLCRAGLDGWEPCGTKVEVELDGDEGVGAEGGGEESSGSNDAPPTSDGVGGREEDRSRHRHRRWRDRCTRCATLRSHAVMFLSLHLARVLMSDGWSALLLAYTRLARLLPHHLRGAVLREVFVQIWRHSEVPAPPTAVVPHPPAAAEAPQAPSLYT